MKKTNLTYIAIFLLAQTGWAASLVVNSVISQTAGTTTNIPGSGDANNTDIWSVGEVGRYLVGDGINTYGLRISATNPTGSLAAGTDSLMVARTTNSQGLTDTGTLSIYVRSTGRWALNINFAFYDNTFTTPENIDLTLTSLDIDFNQRYYTSTTSFTSNQTYGSTNITTAPAVTGYNGFTAAGNSTFNDAKHAVTSNGVANNFDIQISHDTVALYMFEMRNPPTVVPEPGTMGLLVGAGLAGLIVARRKVHQAQKS